MFPISVIIFREVLEIALILAAVISSTEGLAKRNIAIITGCITGAAASSILALTIHKLNTAFDGMGQEYFLATILFTASIMMAWTVLWMRRHASTLKGKIHQAATHSPLPLITLSVIIAIAILREGFEIILFTYGHIQTNAISWIDIITGSIMGLTAGSLLGYTWYRGMITFAGRHVFTITSILLVFMAAGMASQGLHMLIAADSFHLFTAPLWDSTWLLKDGSMVAKMAKSLFGYQARPTLAEVLMYAIFLIVVFTLSWRKHTILKQHTA